jgi:hypothetical protein
VTHQRLAKTAINMGFQKLIPVAKAFMSLNFEHNFRSLNLTSYFMLRVPISSLPVGVPLTKQQMLARCGSIARFCVTIAGHEYDRNQDDIVYDLQAGIVYDLQAGIEDGKDVIAHTIQAQFCEMEIHVLDGNHRNFRRSSEVCAAVNPFSRNNGYLSQTNGLYGRGPQNSRATLDFAVSFRREANPMFR